MQLVADLHLHSKYSRAVSQNMILQTMEVVAIEKGIDLLSVSDWTHPQWIKEIGEQLEEVGEGVYRLAQRIESQGQREDQREPKFIFSTEISSIYTQGGKLRRIHSLVFVPSFETAQEVSNELRKKGANLNADGRPIIGLSAKDLLSLILEIDEHCMLIPAHVWTPHFGVYGSASGFDSLTEAFGDLERYVYGVETGLSSDPEMNWQIPELSGRSILSFSDAHSPAKMGREATVFVYKDGQPAGGSNDKLRVSNIQFSYEDLRKIFMRQHPHWKIGYTVEFYPEEGKYHFSGHRNCKIAFGPEEIRTRGSACPVCGKRVTEGVLYRLQQLSSEQLEKRVITESDVSGVLWHKEKEHAHPPFVKLVPLLEIVAQANDSTVLSKKTQRHFAEILTRLGSEMEILLTMPVSVIEEIAGGRVAEGIRRVRSGEIRIHPGYDGEFGRVRIWGENEPVDQTENAPQLRIPF